MTVNEKAAVIEKIKKIAGGVRLYISSLDDPLLLSNALIEADGLKEGMELHPNYLKQLLGDSKLNECDAKAAGMLSRRDYSIGEFKRKLRLQNFSESDVKEITFRYKSKGLLDDKKYAARVVNKIINEKPSGKPYLMGALRKKLIPREIAVETVDSVMEDQDDTDLAVQALSKRWRNLGQFDVEEARRKAYNYLSRRGFSYSAAREAFQKLWQTGSGGQTEENEY